MSAKSDIHNWKKKIEELNKQISVRQALIERTRAKGIPVGHFERDLKELERKLVNIKFYLQQAQGR
jgi:hypothetical protein